MQWMKNEKEKRLILYLRRISLPGPCCGLPGLLIIRGNFIPVLSKKTWLKVRRIEAQSANVESLTNHSCLKIGEEIQNTVMLLDSEAEQLINANHIELR